jgi:rubrerythrin
MAKMFDSIELVKYGIQVEKNGRDFYDLASKNVKAERVRQVFEFISNDEQHHIAIFEGILTRVNANSRPAEYLTEEYMEYLSALMELTVFTKPKQGYEIAKTMRNDKHALELSVGLKKDSILLYTEMKRSLPIEHRDELDNLISQEQDHFKRLSDTLKGFSKFGVNRD